MLVKKLQGLRCPDNEQLIKVTLTEENVGVICVVNWIKNKIIFKKAHV